MNSEKILIIEDDPQIAKLVAINLEDLGFAVDICYDGREGLETALNGDYQLLVLDVMLPGLDGIEICKRIRQEKNSLPILMLTAKSTVTSRVLGLEMGADDYVIKPFSIEELIARVRALLRRDRRKEVVELSSTLETETIVFGRLEIELKKRALRVNGQGVTLTAKEFDLLVFLASHPGRCFTRQELLDRVWGYKHRGYQHTVSSHINRIRTKIEANPANPRYVITVYGFGYRFAEQEEIEDDVHE